MRRIVLLAAFLFLLKAGFAQFSVGLNMPYVGWQPLNHIIDRYNESRPWLDDEMENIHFMPGLTFSLGSHEWGEPVGFDLLSWRIAGRTVESAGNDHWRKLRVRISTLSIMGGTYYFINGESNRLGFGVWPVELSNFRVKSKTDETGKYERLWKSSNILGIPVNASTTFFLDLGHLTGESVLTLRLYAQLAWWKDEKLIYVNQALNYNQTNNMLQRQEMGVSHIGFQLLISADR